MKKTVKIMMLVVFVATSTGSFAQKFGLKGGLNLSNMLVKDDDDTYSDDYEMNPGYHVGVTAEYPISDMLSFETGLLLSTKGFKLSEEEDGDKAELKLNLLYLDLPLTAKATFDFGVAKFYGLFGPYLGVGLSGKSKFEVTFSGETESDEEDVEWGSDEDEDDLKRLDYGLAMGAGVEINSVRIGLTYNLGFLNISPYSDDGFKMNNRVIGISVGYTFGGE